MTTHQRAIAVIDRLEKHELIVTEIMRVCSHFHRNCATKLITGARDITHDELDRIEEVIDQMTAEQGETVVEIRGSKNGLWQIQEKLRKDQARVSILHRKRRGKKNRFI